MYLFLFINIIVRYLDRILKLLFIRVFLDFATKVDRYLILMFIPIKKII